MNRTQRVLQRARYSLSDPNKTRWTDEHLLTLLSEGQRDMATRALLLKKTIFMPLIANKAIYTLPTDYINLEAAWVSSKGSRYLLEYVAYRDLSKRVRNWQSVSGRPQYIVTELDNRLTITLYPMPKDIETTSSLDRDSITGIITGGKGIKLDNPYGTITDFNEVDVEQLEAYGIVTGMQKVVDELELLYYYTPDYLKSDDEDLVLPDTVDQGLQHYVVGMALRDDKDTMNRQMGMEELNLYSLEVKRNLSDSAKDFNPAIRTIPYNGGLQW